MNEMISAERSCKICSLIAISVLLKLFHTNVDSLFKIQKGNTKLISRPKFQTITEPPNNERHAGVEIHCTCVIYILATN